jgi:uncharacterized membrane protein
VKGPDLKAWMWFVSSYAPLWFMLALRFHPCWLRIGLTVLGIVGVAVVAGVLLRGVRERPSNPTLMITGDAGGEVSGYLAAYLLPFLTVSDPMTTDLVAYAIFVLVAGTVYIRSGLMQINPTVYLLGWRVLRADDDHFVLSRTPMRAGTKLQAERFSERVYIHHSEVP